MECGVTLIEANVNLQVQLKEKNLKLPNTTFSNSDGNLFLTGFYWGHSNAIYNVNSKTEAKIGYYGLSVLSFMRNNNVTDRKYTIMYSTIVHVLRVWGHLFHYESRGAQFLSCMWFSAAGLGDIIVGSSATSAHKLSTSFLEYSLKTGEFRGEGMKVMYNRMIRFHLSSSRVSCPVHDGQSKLCTVYPL